MATEIQLRASDFYPRAGTSAPQWIEVAGTNGPVEYMAFDAAADETAFSRPFRMPVNYAGEDIKAKAMWNAATGTSGNFVLGIALMAVTPNTDTGSIQAEGFGTEDVSMDDTHLGTTALRLHEGPEVTLTGAELDGIAAGDWVQVRVSRKTASDNLSGDAQVVHVNLSFG